MADPPNSSNLNQQTAADLGNFNIPPPPTGILGTDTSPDPIGVPKGFTAKSTTTYQPGRGGHDPEDDNNYGFYPVGPPATLETSIPPRYLEGMEWDPGAWSSEKIADLQSQMVDAGVLDRNSYQRGFWDATSASAYKKLLAYSNAAGLDYNSTLSRYKEVIAKYGRPEDKSAATRQPFIGQQIDPERLNSLLDDVSVRAMGRKITPTEKAAFSSAFNQSYVTNQRSEYDMQNNYDDAGNPVKGSGGVVTSLDPTAQAEKYLRETHPQEIKEYDYLSRFNQFQQLIGA